MFFCKQKNQNFRKPKYLPDLEPLGARPKTPCKRMFSLLHNLSQANAARGSYILNVMRLAFTAAMHTPLLHIYLRFGFRRNLKMLNNLLAPLDLTLAIFCCRDCYISLRRGGHWPFDLTSSLSQLRWQLPSKGAFCLGKCIGWMKDCLERVTLDLTLVSVILFVCSVGGALLRLI